MSAEFLKPKTLDEALRILSDLGEEAKVLAGGTALSLLLRHRLVSPGHIVSLDGLTELGELRTSEQGLHIGSMVLLRDIERSLAVQETHSILASACGQVGNVRVRNQATLGGNLAEADYASDPPTALLALNASIRIASLEGERMLPISEFFRGLFGTALQPHEILVEILIPELKPTTRGVYLKYRSRSSEDRPCVAVAALADFEDGLCTELRVAVGAASETPQRLPHVDAKAHQESLEEPLIGEIAANYSEAIDTIDDLRGSAWYRHEMIRVLVARAIRVVRADGR